MPAAKIIGKVLSISCMYETFRSFCSYLPQIYERVTIWKGHNVGGPKIKLNLPLCLIKI